MSHIEAYSYEQNINDVSLRDIRLHSRHLRILEELQEIAVQKAGMKGFRVAAGLVLRNRIISVGWNRTKSHPFQRRHTKHPEAIYSHAETMAIHEATKRHFVDLSRATLYVVRVSAKGERALARPCVGCLDAITDYDIPRVIYSTFTNDLTDHACGANCIHTRLGYEIWDL